MKTKKNHEEFKALSRKLEEAVSDKSATVKISNESMHVNN